MGLFDFVSSIKDMIEDEISYQEMVDTVTEYWAFQSQLGNPGQQAILWDCVEPTGQEVMAGWEFDWPNIEVDEYYDATIDSHEAAPETWSDSIQEITGTIAELADEAQSALEEFFDDDGEEDDDGGDEEGDFF